MIDAEQLEGTTESTTLPYNCHELELESQTYEKNKEQLKELLKELQDNKISKVMNKIESNNETLLKKGIDEVIYWSVINSFHAISTIAVQVKKFLSELPYKILERESYNYFNKKFGFNEKEFQIYFVEKKGGDQLGRRMTIINLKDGKEIIYHVKTHRDGLKSQVSNSAKKVDLKELLIYKILELSGIGVETHFFGKNEKDFYIATKDASYEDTNLKQGEFLTYDKIRKKKSVEELLNDSIIVNGFIKADIISRLLSLSDIIDNGGNTGVSTTFKIIDFSPPLKKTYEITTIFVDWLSGNNQYNYSDKTVISILKGKEKTKKIADSIKVIKELGDFCKVVLEAFHILKDSDIVKKLELYKIDVNDINFYTNSILNNYDYFMKGINENISNSEINLDSYL
jgi:hypothetical protein